MSDRKPESWWGSFDHMVRGSRTKGARCLQADREAKFKNKYGRNHPQEQQPQHHDGAGEANQGEDTSTGDKDPALVDLVDLDDAPQSEEHDDLDELLQDAARDFGNQQQQDLQQHDQQQQDLVADQQPQPNQESDPEDVGSNLTGDSNSDTDSELESTSGTSSSGESDDDDMAGTKIGISKFTGQETDVSDKARDWFTGLQTYFTKKSIGAGEWERRCGLIRWSLVSDSIPDGQDLTSTSS